MGQDLTRLDLVPSVSGPGGGSHTSRAPEAAQNESGAPMALNGAGVGECLAKVFGHMSRLEPAAHTGRASPWRARMIRGASGQKSEGEAGLAGSRSGWGI